jgi:hypothetical protein
MLYSNYIKYIMRYLVVMFICYVHAGLEVFWLWKS